MFSEDMAILMGSGVVSWPPTERESGRYGFITLYSGVRKESRQLFFKRVIPEYGKLGALVTETRIFKSSGDLKRGFKPTVPNRGDKFILGVGILWYPGSEKNKSINNKGDPRGLGLRPIIDEIIPRYWLDPEILYKIVNQTCRIFFIPLIK